MWPDNPLIQPIVKTYSQLVDRCLLVRSLQIPSQLLFVLWWRPFTFHISIGTSLIHWLSKYINNCRRLSFTGVEDVERKLKYAASTSSRGNRANAISFLQHVRISSFSPYDFVKPSAWMRRYIAWVKWKKHPLWTVWGNYLKRNNRCLEWYCEELTSFATAGRRPVSKSLIIRSGLKTRFRDVAVLFNSWNNCWYVNLFRSGRSPKTHGKPLKRRNSRDFSIVKFLTCFVLDRVYRIYLIKEWWCSTEGSIHHNDGTIEQ